ncbi:hypothetical protein AT292_00235 [Enterobacter cloacae]|nr:hypothetical protein AT292_00235 [Enterobacter cloacae]
MTLSAQYGDSKASIDRIDSAMASDREATSSSLLRLETDVNGNKASINSLNQTFSDYQQATATQINGITATINGHTSAITTNAQAIANVNDDLKAMYSIKVAVDANGKQYAAGMGIGVENTPSGMQSQVLFLADRFAVMAQAGERLHCRSLSRTGRCLSGKPSFRTAPSATPRLATTSSPMIMCPAQRGGKSLKMALLSSTAEHSVGRYMPIAVTLASAGRTRRR